MTKEQAIAELNALASSDDPDALNRLGRIDGYLLGGDSTMKDQLVIAFRDQAPETDLSMKIIDKLTFG